MPLLYLLGLTIAPKLQQLGNLICEVTQLPVMACRRDGETLYLAPGTEALAAPPEANRTLIDQFLAAASEAGIPRVEIVEPMFFWAVGGLMGGACWLVGPAAPARPEAGDIAKLAAWRKIPEAQSAGGHRWQHHQPES